MKNKKIKLAVAATLMIWLSIAVLADLALATKVEELVKKGKSREYAECVVDMFDNSTSDFTIARVALFGGSLKKNPLRDVSFAELVYCLGLKEK